LAGGFEEGDKTCRESTNVTCPGQKLSDPRDLHKIPEFRLGGTRWSGFFVPPRTASYAFTGQFTGQFELRLSPDGKRENAGVVEMVADTEEGEGEGRRRLDGDAAQHRLVYTSNRRVLNDGVTEVGDESFPTEFLYNPPRPQSHPNEDENGRRLTYTPNPSHYRVPPQSDIFSTTNLSPPLKSSRSYLLTKDRKYFFQLLHTSSSGASQSLLGLEISNGTNIWETTFEVGPFGNGLSGEFLGRLRFLRMRL